MRRLSNHSFAPKGFERRSSPSTTVRTIVPANSWMRLRQGLKTARTPSRSSTIEKCPRAGLESRTHWPSVSHALRRRGSSSPMETSPSRLKLWNSHCVRQSKTASDHFVLVPTLTHEGLLAAGVQGSIQVLGQWAARMWKVQDPESKRLLRSRRFQSAPCRCTSKPSAGWNVCAWRLWKTFRSAGS